MHDVAAQGAPARRLALSLAVTLSVFVIEVLGAIFSGSVALLADSAHVLTDSTGLVLALFAALLSGRPATTARTFGWKRMEVLAAAANGFLMLGIAVFVVVEGVERLVTPPEVRSWLMLSVAFVGLVANLVVMGLLARDHRRNINVRGAYLEVWGDMVGSLLVIVAAVVIGTTGFSAADGIASIVIGALILPRAVLLLRQVGEVLLEASPRGMDMTELRRHLTRIPGVVQVHDLHVWSITQGVPSLTVHALIDEGHAADVASGKLLQEFQECTRKHFDVSHSTFQFEVGEGPECGAEQGDGAPAGVPDRRL